MFVLLYLCRSVFVGRQNILERLRGGFVCGLDGVGVNAACRYRIGMTKAFGNRCQRNAARDLQCRICVPKGVNGNRRQLLMLCAKLQLSVSLPCAVTLQIVYSRLRELDDAV